MTNDLNWIVIPETNHLLDDSQIELLLANRIEEIFTICEKGLEQRAKVIAAIERALFDPTRVIFVLKLLHKIRKKTAQKSASRVFRVERLCLETASHNDSLDLLLVPSIFEPEDWGFTFLEGLLRRPLEDFSEKRLVEVGTGSGWISIALLRMTELTEVFGLDLNPIAVKLARINAVLNSYDDRLLPRYDSNRRLLYERFTTAKSDLLSVSLEEEKTFDYIVGCIPQVLAPNPDLDPRQTLTNLDESGLYDLSNYFVLQGVYEDQFGLGLLAKTLEQSVHVLKPGGKVILNIAGRPGSKVISRMFTRRGFTPQVVWRRRVQQAEDTDIAVLATLEQRTQNPFEFFMSRHSREPIGATTAHLLKNAKHPLWHDLKVYEARLQFERHMRPFYEATKELGYTDFIDQLDLSAISAEPVGFLRTLASSFRKAKLAPYTHEVGHPALRRVLARYLNDYFDLGVSSEEIFGGPNREELVHGLLRSFCQPAERVLVSAQLHTVYQDVFQKAGLGFFVGNNDLHEIATLTEALKPSFVLVSLSKEERRNFSAIRHLLETTRLLEIPIVFDGSYDFDITSELHANPLFECLAQEGLQGHVFVIIGLIRNKVYPGLTPAFLVGVTPALQKALIAFAESTYSRNNTFVELYYFHLFEEILSFQLRAQREIKKTSLEGNISLSLSNRTEKVLASAAFHESVSKESITPVLRLDYGENELEIPDRLVQGLLLGFTNLGNETSEEYLGELIASFTEKLLYQTVSPDEVLLGAGVFPLLFDAALAVCDELGRPARVAIPRGHYGYILPLFLQAGCEVEIVPTKEEDNYLLTKDSLQKLSKPVDIIFLNNPVNPGGIYYPSHYLSQIATFLAEHPQLRIFSDEIFSGLDLSEESEKAPSLLDYTSTHRERILHFNGLSKMFAAGGLRVGWVLSQDKDFLARMKRFRSLGIVRHARMATEILFRGFHKNAKRGVKEIEQYLLNIRTQLKERRQNLLDILLPHGLIPLEGRPGGLFVFPSIKSLSGRDITTSSGETIQINQTNFATVLRQEAGLQVNPGVWAGVEERIRICFSLHDSRFGQSLRRLEKFFAKLTK